MKEFESLGKKGKSKAMKTAKLTRRAIAGSKGTTEKMAQKAREKAHSKMK